ncbi:hypothetical protein ACFSTC_09430 [Nonomuraea ferruginea]
MFTTCQLLTLTVTIMIAAITCALFLATGAPWLSRPARRRRGGRGDAGGPAQTAEQARPVTRERSAFPGSCPATV